MVHFRVTVLNTTLSSVEINCMKGQWIERNAFEINISKVTWVTDACETELSLK